MRAGCGRLKTDPRLNVGRSVAVAAHVRVKLASQGYDMARQAVERSKGETCSPCCPRGRCSGQDDTIRCMCHRLHAPTSRDPSPMAADFTDIVPTDAITGGNLTQPCTGRRQRAGTNDQREMNEGRTQYIYYIGPLLLHTARLPLPYRACL